MALLDRFRRASGSDYQNASAPSEVTYADLETALSGNFAEILKAVNSKSPAQLWAEQPYLRTVVTFMARNIAQLGLHVYQRVGETDRQRVRDGALPAALKRPNLTTTGYELIYGLVADLGLYDRAFLLVSPGAEQPIVRLPNAWVTPAGGGVFGPDRYVVRSSSNGEARVIPAENIIDFHGWSPRSLAGGSSPIEALKGILAEQMSAAEYRRQVWERGGRVSSVLERPAGAQWSPEARERFRADWRQKYTGTGPGAGGTPILEDGMQLKRVDFSAHEQEYVEGARLALNTVASVYHINPTMIGLLDNANYSNVREFRRMLYGDTLGPLMAQIEDRLNNFLVPMLDDRDGIYVEFNIDEKMQGSFEEQNAALASAIGRPHMTVNEGRAVRNMPAIEGGDELVTPLNVLVGGQASQRDSGSQNRNSGTAQTKASGIRVKERAAATYESRYREALSEFFDRQGRVIKSRIGGSDDWWDADRWDSELAEDLLRLAALTSDAVALATLEAAGLGEDAFDPERTRNFLREASRRDAEFINATTRDQVVAALDADEPAEAVSNVFNVAADSRAEQIAVTAVTFASAFGTTEAARQNSSTATKTWIVTSGNPRASHAAMDGETVPVDDLFSNGLMWPGGIGDPDEVAGCQCELSIQF